MEINKSFLIFLLLLFFLPHILYSEDFQGYNLPYYDKGIGGSPSGLGGAFVSIADDGNTPFYNPAGLSDINLDMITLNYRSSFIGSENLFFLSYLYNINPKTGVGFSFIWTGVSGLQSYDENQLLTGSYNISRFQVGISYGRKIHDRVSIGLTGKFFSHKLYTYSANNIDFDAGTKIRLLPELFYGLAIQNFLPMGYKLRDESEDIPFTVKTGFNYRLFRGKLMLVYEIDKTILSSFNDTGFTHHMGLRYSPMKYVNINGGYDLKNFYMGINLKLEKFIFYSGTIRNEDAGDLNFSASYIFPQKSESGVDEEMETFYQGIVAYQNKDYRTAVKYFEKVLNKRYDPTAEYYLKNSKAYLESEEWMSDEEKVLVGMKLELAKKYLSQKEYGRTISTLRDVLNINPSNEEAIDLMNKAKKMVAEDVKRIYEEALSLFKKNKNRESLEKCNIALKLNPEHKPTLQLKEENEKILKDLFAEEFQDKQRKEEAEVLFNGGLESYKNANWVDAIDKFKRSYKLVKNPETKKYLDDAEKQLKESKLTAKKRKESDVHLKLGLKHMKRNKIKKAIDEFEKAVNLYPDNQEAQENLNIAREKYDSMVQIPLEKGKTALRENRLGDAIDSFKKVLKIDKDNEIAKQFLKKSQSLVKDNIALNLRLGKQEYNNKNYARSLAHYREVLKLDKKNKTAKKGADQSFAKLQTEIKLHFNKGVDAYNNKKYKTALDEFEKTLALDKEYPPAIEWHKKASAKFEQNKESLTIEEYMDNGKDYFQNKNFKQAKIFFQKVLDIDPNHKKAKSNIKRCDKEIAKMAKQEEIAKIITEGLIHYRRKKFNKAIDVWRKAKKIEPQNKIIDDYIKFAQKAKVESLNKFYNDGVRYYEEGNLIKAKENLDKALQTNPNHSKARQKLAEVKSSIFEIVSRAKKDGKNDFRNSDYDGAEKNFQTVLKYDPENEEINDYIQMTKRIQDYIEEGNRHYKKGAYIEAIESFNNVLEYNKNDTKAKKLIQKALQKGKRQASKWYNNGLRFYKNGELKKAQNRFSSVLKADPDHDEAKSMLKKVDKEINSKVSAYYKNGLSYYEQKNYKKAISEFNKILDLKGNYKDTRRLLAKSNKIYDKQTSKQRALSQQKVQEYLFSGIKLYRDGKLKAAITEWKKVLKVYPNHAKATKYINRAKYKLSQLEKLK